MGLRTHGRDLQTLPEAADGVVPPTTPKEADETLSGDVAVRVASLRLLDSRGHRRLAGIYANCGGHTICSLRVGWG